MKKKISVWFFYFEARFSNAPSHLFLKSYSHFPIGFKARYRYRLMILWRGSKEKPTLLPQDCWTQFGHIHFITVELFHIGFVWRVSSLKELFPYRILQDFWSYLKRDDRIRNYLLIVSWGYQDFRMHCRRDLNFLYRLKAHPSTYLVFYPTFLSIFPSPLSFHHRIGFIFYRTQVALSIFFLSTHRKWLG